MNTSDDKLKVAAQEGDISLLYTLIQEDLHVLDHMDLTPFAETPLHIVACVGHLQFATEIMRLKPSFAWNMAVLGFVDINKNLVRVKGRDGLTPLHFASQTGEVDL